MDGSRGAIVGYPSTILGRTRQVGGQSEHYPSPNAHHREPGGNFHFAPAVPGVHPRPFMKASLHCGWGARGKRRPRKGRDFYNSKP